MFESQLTACMARFRFLRKVESCQGASFETFGALFGVCPVVVVERFEASFCERDIDLANRGLWREMKGGRKGCRTNAVTSSAGSRCDCKQGGDDKRSGELHDEGLLDMGYRSAYLEREIVKMRRAKCHLSSNRKVLCLVDVRKWVKKSETGDDSQPISWNPNLS
jgi:hypothetical protein